MVERIVTAGREVLVEHGYDACSTNRVATRAGISPGSLYQYFPDKQAVLAAVIDRYWDDVTERVAAALGDRVADEAGPAMVRATADALLAALERDPALLRVVVRQLPAQEHEARRASLERRVVGLATAYLGPRLPRDHRRDVAAVAWVVVVAVENLAVRWVLDQPAGISRNDLLDQVVALVGGYLGMPGVAGMPAGSTT
ncbi:MAG: TetR family transcriptional regulator [Nocardioides sp.]|nr:TetR family transcriptional regulator [Nocardioides sp.]